MTKKHPISYLLKKQTTANSNQWTKSDIEAVTPAREEILESIKRRLEAKKKKR